MLSRRNVMRVFDNPTDSELNDFYSNYDTLKALNADANTNFKNSAGVQPRSPQETRNLTSRESNGLCQRSVGWKRLCFPALRTLVLSARHLEKAHWAKQRRTRRQGLLKRPAQPARRAPFSTTRGGVRHSGGLGGRTGRSRFHHCTTVTESDGSQQGRAG